jgi:hypothetical protein
LKPEGIASEAGIGDSAALSLAVVDSPGAVEEAATDSAGAADDAAGAAEDGAGDAEPWQAATRSAAASRPASRRRP